MAKAGQTGIFESHPNPQTVRFAGRSVCLSAIAREVGLTPSYLSYLFSGKRTPSFPAARKISLALGMRLDEFTSALDSHIDGIRASENQSQLQLSA